MSDVTDEKRGRVAYVTLNRPERRNAINSAMAAELVDTFMEIRSDDGVWVVIVTGAGNRAFCAGADLVPMQGPPAVSKGRQRPPSPRRSVKRRASMSSTARFLALPTR